MPWAEDKAIRGRNLSAGPGAKIEAGAACWSPVFPRFGIGIKAINPSGRSVQHLERENDWIRETVSRIGVTQEGRFSI